MALRAIVKDTLVFGIARKNRIAAFSLIELIIVVAIIGLMATIFVPNLQIFKKRQADKEFIASLNYISKLASDNATNTGKLHRVVFDLDNAKIFVEQQEDDNFVKSESANLTNAGTFEGIEIVNIFINGIDEMQLKSGESKKNTVWYFVVPNGLTQEVIINYDVGQAQKNLVIDPFSARFKGGNGYKIP
jgi:prepilin-type N-terminal cleavage/methylation domain-containing protein